MPVTNLTKDLEGASLTIETRHEASPARLWGLWADARKLERWWGPPSHLATVTDHDLAPGGTVRYHMTGPDGEQHHGGWRVIAAHPPERLEFEDFFADDSGAEDADLTATTTVVSIEDDGAGGSIMTMQSQYPSPAAMQQVLEMGMEEGIRQALGQIDTVLADTAG